jgi:hypothetical protein
LVAGNRRTEDLERLYGKLFAILVCEPDWRFGAMLGQEGDRWIVTLGGYLGSSNLRAACRSRKNTT